MKNLNFWPSSVVFHPWVVLAVTKLRSYHTLSHLENLHALGSDSVPGLPTFRARAGEPVRPAGPLPVLQVLFHRPQARRGREPHRTGAIGGTAGVAADPGTERYLL